MYRLLPIAGYGAWLGWVSWMAIARPSWTEPIALLAGLTLTIVTGLFARQYHDAVAQFPATGRRGLLVAMPRSWRVVVGMVGAYLPWALMLVGFVMIAVTRSFMRNHAIPPETASVMFDGIPPWAWQALIVTAVIECASARDPVNHLLDPLSDYQDIPPEESVIVSLGLTPPVEPGPPPALVAVPEKPLRTSLGSSFDHEAWPLVDVASSPGGNDHVVSHDGHDADGHHEGDSRNARRGALRRRQPVATGETTSRRTTVSSPDLR